MFTFLYNWLLLMIDYCQYLHIWADEEMHVVEIIEFLSITLYSINFPKAPVWN